MLRASTLAVALLAGTVAPALPPPAYAQRTSEVTGQVKDSTGAVLYRITYRRTRDRIARCHRVGRPLENPGAMRALIRADLGLGDELHDRAAAIIRQAVDDALALQPPRW